MCISQKMFLLLWTLTLVALSVLMSRFPIRARPVTRGFLAVRETKQRRKNGAQAGTKLTKHFFSIERRITAEIELKVRSSLSSKNTFMYEGTHMLDTACLVLLIFLSITINNVVLSLHFHHVCQTVSVIMASKRGPYRTEVYLEMCLLICLLQQKLINM